MPAAVKWLGFAIGVGVALVTAGSAIRTLVVPRGGTSRIALFVGHTIVRRGFLAMAKRFDDYESRDRILSLSAPLSLLANLLAWLLLFWVGFGLMLWPLVDGDLLTALRESGSSMLTLGYAGTPTFGATLVHFAAAVTGLIAVALQIAYLPTIYSAFNRRENLVTLLQSRAGAPAWGPELLARTALVDLRGELPRLYGAWEEWAADVGESHSNYPVLAFFRSPVPLRSWIVGLLAVLDSAALYLATCPGSAPVEARLCLRMGFVSLRDIATVLRIPHDPDPYPDEPIRLTYEEYVAGIRRMEEAGFPMERTAEQAWADFRGWRVNYEAIVYAIADAVEAVPGPWTGERTRLPGMAIVPARPANRRPDDPEAHREPKATRSHWRA